jgi:transcriptional regulator with XRE-family HTH domain
VDLDDARTIGHRVRQIRRSRRKSLRVVAGLAGMSKSKLDRIERGEVALDRLSDIVALADVLQIAPSDLMRLPVPAPGNGDVDAAVAAVRCALVAVDLNRPAGQVLPAKELRRRVERVLAARRRCRFTEVGDALPNLIRDLHTSIAAGRELDQLLPQAVIMHVHVTRMWLDDAGTGEDLRRDVALLARELADQHGEITTLGVAAFGTAYALLASGMLDLAQEELNSVLLPPTTPQTAGLIGGLTMTHALIAAVEKRHGDAAAPMEAAAELAARFGELGESDPLGFGFGPTNVGMRNMELALESGEPDRAISIAAGVHPLRLPRATRQASSYWIRYGRALARVRGRDEDAVNALRTAESLFPTRVQRDPIVRELLAELLYRSRRDAVGRELRGMAYRSGLPV